MVGPARPGSRSRRRPDRRGVLADLSCSGAFRSIAQLRGMGASHCVKCRRRPPPSRPASTARADDDSASPVGAIDRGTQSAPSSGASVPAAPGEASRGRAARAHRELAAGRNCDCAGHLADRGQSTWSRGSTACLASGERHVLHAATCGALADSGTAREPARGALHRSRRRSNDHGVRVDRATRSAAASRRPVDGPYRDRRHSLARPRRKRFLSRLPGLARRHRDARWPRGL